MQVAIRLKLETGGRSVVWIRAHPEPTELYTTGLARLEGLLTSAETLAQQQRNGHGVVKESAKLRKALRQSLLQDPLRHLARIAQAAAAKQPGLDARFKHPSGSTSHKAFLTAAHDMVAEAAARKELFQRYGMADDFLATLSATLDQYDVAVKAAATGRSAHVGARAQLQAVTEEVMQLLDDFDAMYQFRYRAEPELRAAWESARNVAWPVPESKAQKSKALPIAPAA